MFVGAWMISSLLGVFSPCVFVRGAVESPPTWQCSRQALDDLSPQEVDQMEALRGLMATAEMALLRRFLLAANSYFEFGVGGSTTVACELPHLQYIHGVETSLEYLQDIVRQSACLSRALHQRHAHLPLMRVALQFVDLGPVHLFGRPQNLSDPERWIVYPNAFADVFSQTLPYQDSLFPQVVFIDGRFRVASALAVLLAFSTAAPADPRDAYVLLMHDFFSRPDYYPVLQYMDVIDCVRDLVALRPKAEVNLTAARDDFQRYRFVMD